MALSKSLRFAVLRRDDYTCRYCGTEAKDGAKLTIDHIVAVALGGSDDPTNLVTACFDCNAGKAAMPADVQAPDEQMLRQLQEQVDTLRLKLELQRQRDEMEHAYLSTLGVYKLEEFFLQLFPNGRSVLKRGSLVLWLETLGMDTVWDAANYAYEKKGSGEYGARYFFATCWAKLREAQGGS